MKINAKQALKNFKGDILKDPDGEVTLGTALSNILSMAKEGGKMKLFILAKKFYERASVEIDQSDMNLVKKSVESTDIYPNMVTGQVLEILEGIKE